MPSTPPCACGRPRRRAIAPPAERTGDGVTVRLEGVGVLVCDAGHASVVDTDLADHLLDQARQQVLVAERRRLRRRDVCGDCGASLDLPPRVTETPVVDDVGPTVVTLVPRAPMARCPDCGREQWPDAVADTIAELARAAIEDLGTASAGTSPDGDR